MAIPFTYPAWRIDVWKGKMAVKGSDDRVTLLSTVSPSW